MTKTLYSNYNASNGCLIIKHTVDNIDTRFKITASIGNCYYRGDVKIQTKNGDWQTVLTLEDTNVKHTCSYVSSNENCEQSIKTVIAELTKILKKIYN